MTYPNSSDVSSGQPTAASQYNNLRKDALLNGNVAADSVYLASLLATYNTIKTITYLATNRLRVPYDSTRPSQIMINGYMLSAGANVDLSANSFSGGAALWYIFAVRTPSSNSFTLSVNTSSSPATDSRLIGEVYWDGSNIMQNSIRVYSNNGHYLADADYDSDWFAVTYNTSYTKNHGLGDYPRLVQLWHCTSSTGAAQRNLVTVVGPSTAAKCPLGVSATAILITTGNDSANGTLYSTQGNSAAGYYRILAWR